MFLADNDPLALVVVEISRLVLFASVEKRLSLIPSFSHSALSLLSFSLLRAISSYPPPCILSGGHGEAVIPSLLGLYYD